MLPKVYRLPLRGQWLQIKKEGKVFSGKFLRLTIAQALETDSWGKNSRFGFIVSSKVSKKATLRNRLKRLLREAVRVFLPHIKDRLAVVVSAKPTILGKTKAEIKRELERLFQTAQILKP